jgi:two-component system NtrC family sensor kinase
LTIQVQDQGPGIPGGELETIFDLYQRTSVVSPEGHKSTGLGLAIAKNIITAHGGELVVESRVGEGTIFTVTLPINPNKSFNGRNYD